jgi:hypothetical protein
MRLIHPYSNLTDGRWMRGNLHTHTTRSDGERPQQDVIDDYAAHGYNFLMLSDHDIYTSPDDYATLNAQGMILIPGNEVSDAGVHLLHVKADTRVEPDADRQKVIDQINASNNGGFAIVNHPNWFRDWDHCTQEQLEGWQSYAGIEIYNGTIGRLEGSQYATDRWDRLLSKGRRIWGFANDDSHLAVGEVGMGWNVAYVKTPTVDAVTTALKDGEFYTSTGVVINSIEVEGTRIRIETANADRIIAITSHQRRFVVTDTPTFEVDLAAFPGIDQYVRFECLGRGEQFAWTQPFFIQQ